jgi:hypothetical protein
MATAADELRDVTARARAKPQTLNELASHPAVHDQGLSHEEVSAVLADMVARGPGHVGFERHCDLCGLTELVALTAAAAVPPCTGCGRAAAYTTRDGEPVLHYALGSLLQRVSRNAALTPLAASAALRQQGYYIVPGADIFAGGNMTGNPTCWGGRTTGFWRAKRRRPPGRLIPAERRNRLQQHRLAAVDGGLRERIAELRQQVHSGQHECQQDDDGDGDGDSRDADGDAAAG